jgi:hypothetical protein
LESVYTGNRIVGSNPTPSASFALNYQQKFEEVCHSSAFLDSNPV